MEMKIHNSIRGNSELGNERTKEVKNLLGSHLHTGLALTSLTTAPGDLPIALGFPLP